MTQSDVESMSEEDQTACHFDLFFLRWSLLVDGVLTAGAALATQSWHVYLGMSPPTPNAKHLLGDLMMLTSNHV